MSAPRCDYSALAENGDTPTCWGDVTLVEVIEMSNGDRVPVYACGGHRGTSEQGYYLEPEAEPVTRPVEIPEELTALWDDPLEDTDPSTLTDPPFSVVG